jgi:hypothetical protein
LKIDRYIKAVARRLDNVIANSNGDRNGNSHNDDDLIIYDDEYYIDRGDFPPRFAYYRHVTKKLNLPHEFVVTSDELNYGMKGMLRMSPEDRYQSKKANFLFHDLSCYMRKLGEEDYGCTGAGCIPECRYYPKYGRIEDEELIEEYRKD